MQKTIHILIVEDSDDDTQLLVRQLIRDNYNPVYERVETAEQLRAALDGTNWDIIISDYILPELSGLETLQILREKGLDIPCLIVSGKIGEETAVDAMKAGAKDYIMKDYLKRLSPAIERELAEAEIKRKRDSVEKALRENEKLSSILINGVPNPIVVFNSDLSIRSVNPAFTQITGFLSEEIIGIRAPFPWWPQEKVASYQNELFNYGPDLKKEGEKLFQKKCGERFWVSLLSSCVQDDSQKTEYILSVWRDITAEKVLQQELELLNHRIIQAQEEERKRIARELHEDTTQVLAILKLELESLLQSKDIKSQNTLDKLKYLQENTEHALQDVRRYSYSLRPGVLDHLGLEVSLEQLAEDISESGKLQVDFKVSGKTKKISEDIGLVFFRIAQEALSNVQKHAGASHAAISLKYQSGRLKLLIKDNGRGFDPESISHSALNQGNLGLIGMRERAKLIGASFNVESRLNRGTVVAVEIQH